MPMMLVRMRCPACRYDYRFGVPIDMPLVHLPDITKQVMRCNCKDHIPKIGKWTPIQKTLMSINGVPLRKLIEQAELNRN